MNTIKPILSTFSMAQASGKDPGQLDWGAIFDGGKHAGAPMKTYGKRNRNQQEEGEGSGSATPTSGIQIVQVEDEDPVDESDDAYITSPYGVKISPKRVLLEKKGRRSLVHFAPIRRRTTTGEREPAAAGIGFDNGNIFMVQKSDHWRRLLRKEDWVIIRHVLQDRYGDDYTKIIGRTSGRWHAFPGDADSLKFGVLSSYLLKQGRKKKSYVLDDEIFPFSKWPCLRDYKHVSLGYLRSRFFANDFKDMDLSKDETTILRRHVLSELEQRKDSSCYVSSMSPYSEVFFTDDGDTPSTMVNDGMTVLTKMSILENGILSVDDTADYCIDLMTVMHSYAIHPMHYSHGGHGHSDYGVRANLPPPLLFDGNSRRVFGKSPPAGNDFCAVIGNLAYAALLVHRECRMFAAERLYESRERMQWYHGKKTNYDPSDDSGITGGYLFSVQITSLFRHILPFYLYEVGSFASSNIKGPNPSEMLLLKVSQSSWFSWMQAVDSATIRGKEKSYKSFTEREKELMLIMWIAIARCGCSIRFGSADKIFKTFHEIDTGEGTAALSANSKLWRYGAVGYDIEKYGGNVTHMHITGDMLGALRHFVAVDNVLFRAYSNASGNPPAFTDVRPFPNRLVLSVIHNSGIPSIEQRTLVDNPTWIADMNMVAYNDQPTSQRLNLNDKSVHATTGYVVFERFDELEDGIIMHQIGTVRRGKSREASRSPVHSAWTPWRTIIYDNPSPTEKIFLHIVPGRFSLKSPLNRADPNNEGYVRSTADLPNEEIVWDYDIKSIDSSNRIVLGQKERVPIYCYPVVNRNGIHVDDENPYYPVHRKLACGSILSDGKNDVGILLDTLAFKALTTKATDPSSDVFSPSETKANIIPIAKVEGFGVPNTPGISLSFDIVMRKHAKTVNNKRVSFGMLFLGNLQLRGDRKSWQQVWRAAYNESLPSGFPDDYNLTGEKISHVHRELVYTEERITRISLGGDDDDFVNQVVDEYQKKRAAVLALKQMIDVDFASLPMAIEDDPIEAIKRFDNFLQKYSNRKEKENEEEDLGEFTFLGE